MGRAGCSPLLVCALLVVAQECGGPRSGFGCAVLGGVLGMGGCRVVWAYAPVVREACVRSGGECGVGVIRVCVRGRAAYIVAWVCPLFCLPPCS